MEINQANRADVAANQFCHGIDLTLTVKMFVL
jgi:hypothetical protein